MIQWNPNGEGAESVEELEQDSSITEQGLGYKMSGW